MLLVIGFFILLTLITLKKCILDRITCFFISTPNKQLNCNGFDYSSVMIRNAPLKFFENNIETNMFITFIHIYLSMFIENNQCLRPFYLVNLKWTITYFVLVFSYDKNYLSKTEINVLNEYIL